MSYIADSAEMVRRTRELGERAEFLIERKAKREAQLDQLDAELNAIRLEIEESLTPPEPPRGSVLAFTKYYRSNTPYRFAAIKSDDLWYVTGKHASNLTRTSDGGHTWKSLVKLIRDGEKSGTVVNVCVYKSHTAHLPVVNP